MRNQKITYLECVEMEIRFEVVDSITNLNLSRDEVAQIAKGWNAEHKCTKVTIIESAKQFHEYIIGNNRCSIEVLLGNISVREPNNFRVYQKAALQNEGNLILYLPGKEPYKFSEKSKKMMESMVWSEETK